MMGMGRALARNARALGWLAGVSIILAVGGAHRAHAQDAPPPATSTASLTDYKHFEANIAYENTFQFDYKGHTMAAAALPRTLAGSMTGMRVLANLTYRPFPATMISAFGGSSFLNQMTISGTTPTEGDIVQRAYLDAAATYGLGGKLEFFPLWRFHFGPSFRFLRTDYRGSRGTLTNSGTACTFDFSNTSSTCVTPGMSTGGGPMEGRFSQSEFRARLEIGVDMIGDINAPILGIIAGVEEAITLVRGTFTYMPASAAVSIEEYSFSSTRTEGVYVILFGHIGPIRLHAEGRALAATSISGGVGFNF